MPLASIRMAAFAVSRSFALPTAVILPLTATTVSAARIGHQMSPLNTNALLWITSGAGATDSLVCSCAIRHLPRQIFDARQYTDRFEFSKNTGLKQSTPSRIRTLEVESRF